MLMVALRWRPDHLLIADRRNTQIYSIDFINIRPFWTRVSQFCFHSRSMKILKCLYKHIYFSLAFAQEHVAHLTGLTLKF